MTRTLCVLLLASCLQIGCDSVCSVGGTTYQTGERVPSDDSCNSCRCTVRGVECTTAQCTANDAGAEPPCTTSRCGAPGSDASPARMSCQNISDRSSRALRETVESADTSCSSDADCTVTFLGSACYAGCGVILSVEGESELDRVAAQHEKTLCTGFSESGCVRIIPPCPSPGPAACVDGTCQRYIPSVPRPDGGRGIDGAVEMTGDGAATSPVIDAAVDRDGATAIRIETAHGIATVGVGQTFEISVKASAGSRALDPALSSNMVRFVARRPARTEEQTPGGPVTIYTFEAVASGSVAIVIAFDPQAASDGWPKPQTFTIVVE
jgi:hypothetical protein